jgi:hypothetical protein
MEFYGLSYYVFKLIKFSTGSLAHRVWLVVGVGSRLCSCNIGNRQRGTAGSRIGKEYVLFGVNLHSSGHIS